MYRAVAVLVLAGALATAGTASAARIYVGALPGGGKIKVRTWPGHVRAKVRFYATCKNAESGFVTQKHLNNRRKGHRFHIRYFVNADSGDGSGASETLELKGRLHRGRVLGSLDYESAFYSIHNDDDVSCSSGHLRYTAWRRR